MAKDTLGVVCRCVAHPSLLGAARLASVRPGGRYSALAFPHGGRHHNELLAGSQRPACAGGAHRPLAAFFPTSISHICPGVVRVLGASDRDVYSSWGCDSGGCCGLEKGQFQISDFKFQIKFVIRLKSALTPFLCL